MTITQESKGQMCVFRIDGPMTVTDRDALRDCVHAAIEAGGRVMVLDVSSAGYIDMGALGMLATLCTTLRSMGGDLRLAGVDPALAGVFRLAHLDAMFPAYASTAEAQQIASMAAS